MSLKKRIVPAGARTSVRVGLPVMRRVFAAFQMSYGEKNWLIALFMSAGKLIGAAVEPLPYDATPEHAVELQTRVVTSILGCMHGSDAHGTLMVNFVLGPEECGLLADPRLVPPRKIACVAAPHFRGASREMLRGIVASTNPKFAIFKVEPADRAGLYLLKNQDELRIWSNPFAYQANRKEAVLAMAVATAFERPTFVTASNGRTLDIVSTDYGPLELLRKADRRAGTRQTYDGIVHGQAAFSNVHLDESLLEERWELIWLANKGLDLLVMPMSDSPYPSTFWHAKKRVTIVLVPHPKRERPP